MRLGAEMNLHILLGKSGKKSLFTLSGGVLGALILLKFIQSVLIYASWEIWKVRNRLLFELDFFNQRR